MLNGGAEGWQRGRGTGEGILGRDVSLSTEAGGVLTGDSVGGTLW